MLSALILQPVAIAEVTAVCIRMWYRLSLGRTAVRPYIWTSLTCKPLYLQSWPSATDIQVILVDYDVK